MTGKEHLKFSLYSVALIQAGLAIDIQLDLKQLSIITAGGLIGALVPDVDHHESIAGAIFPFHLLAKWFPRWYIVKHGGITHTLLVNIWIFFAAYFLKSWLVLGIGFGYLTHLYADHITGNKLKYLYYPFGRWLFESNKKRSSSRKYKKSTVRDKSTKKR